MMTCAVLAPGRNGPDQAHEALIDVGVKPELARNVERRLEAALQGQQDTFRVHARDELMTTADGEKLRTGIHAVKADLLKTINDQTWKLIGYVAVLTPCWWRR